MVRWLSKAHSIPPMNSNRSVGFTSMVASKSPCGEPSRNSITALVLATLHAATHAGRVGEVEVLKVSVWVRSMLPSIDRPPA